MAEGSCSYSDSHKGLNMMKEVSCFASLKMTGFGSFLNNSTMSKATAA